MKVLSITEPWATLIMEKQKYIETRSWKTNYRGELYIHASMTKIKKNEKYYRLLELIKNKDLNYGNIICKCKLIDCVYMDEKFIQKIKNNPQEYLCGEYSLGRYAWILDDIEIIQPIAAKGKLGLWEL